MVFKELLKEKMKEKGLTQVMLAHKMGKSQQAVSRWVVGDITPDVEDVVKLAKMLGISEKEIFECFTPNETH